MSNYEKLLNKKKFCDIILQNIFKDVIVLEPNVNINETTENTQQNDIVDQFIDEKAPQFPFLLRRFGEILLISIICSIPFALMYQFGFSKTTDWAYKIMGTSLAAFIIINIYLLRAFYYSMGNRKVYYNVNIVAYMMFAIVNIVMLALFKDQTLPSLYSYLFMPIKFANLLLNEISTRSDIYTQISGAIIIHMIMFGVIFASPLEMYSFDKPKDKKV